jgi:glycosyltransferase involved in cell wall biosynthesis/LmbE family N-acetylglucosaminyl deacetylase
MPTLSLWTRIRWKLQQIHANGIANWLIGRNTNPFVLSDKAALVVAPHPDDESIGCGGLIALKRERNVDVYVLFLTNGSRAPIPDTGITPADLAAIRKKEALTAAAILGVDAARILFLDYPDSTLDSLNDDINRRIADQISEVLENHQIEEVFVPHRNDCHLDHEAAFQLTQRAVQLLGRDISLFQYPIWMLWAAPLFLRLNARALSGAQCLSIAPVLEKKKCAIGAHRSQCATLPAGFLDRFFVPYEIFFHTTLAPTGKTRGEPLPRILFLDHTASLGGAQLSLLRLLRQLDRRHRFELSALLFSEGPLRERIRNAGIPVRVLPLSSDVLQTSRYDIGRLLLQFRSLAETIQYVVRLAQVIRRSNADIVHTNTLKSNLLGGIAAILAKKPVIWHVHDRIASDYMPAPVMHSFRYLARKLPSYVISNSNTTWKLLLGDSERPGRIIYPGVDFSRIPDTTHKIRSDGAVVGLVGRISPTKGHDVFLKAIPSILERFPGARFRIIGGALFNDSHYETELRGLVAELGVADKVTFTGFVDDIEAHIAELDILTVPSTIPESFGQVVAEGMAMGKPVVASNAGGVLEIITDGETGIMFPPGDSARLAEAICTLLENPAEAEQMARRGRAVVAERFTIEHSGREVEQVYEYLLGSDRKATQRNELLKGSVCRPRTSDRQ